VLVFVLIYGFDCGHGFISDDFAWISHGRIEDWASVSRLFGTSVGFYRPLTSLSFGINYAIFGMAPLGYGLTNLGLAILCAWLITVLASELGLSRPVASIAAALWMFNFHGINMAVLWLSGRTSLLLTTFSLIAVIASLRRRFIVSTVCVGAALLSKEEAVVLPALISAWVVLAKFVPESYTNHRVRDVPVPQLIGLWIVLVGYLLLRLNSGAFWIGSAPSYYTMTLDVSSLSRNLAEYADRSLTFSSLWIILAMVWFQRRPGVGDDLKKILVFGGLWFTFGFALTVLLPVRSSLYVVFPSVGAALCAATVVADITLHAPKDRSRKAVLAAMCLLVALVPVYWSRNARWTNLAELSYAVVAHLQRESRGWGDRPTVVIVDDITTRVNLTNAWGSLVPDVSALTLGPAVELSVLPGGESSRNLADFVYQLKGNDLVRLGP